MKTDYPNILRLLEEALAMKEETFKEKDLKYMQEIHALDDAWREVFEKQKAEHENQVKAIIDVNEQKIYQMKAKNMINLEIKAALAEQFIDVNEQKINQIKAEHLKFLKCIIELINELGISRTRFKIRKKINEEISRIESEGKEKKNNENQRRNN